MKSRMTATLAVRGGGEWFEAQTCRGAFLVAPVAVHALVQCYTGTMHTEATMVHWCIGTVYTWYSGSVVQWYTGTLVHIGTLVHYWYRCGGGEVVCSLCRLSALQLYISSLGWLIYRPITGHRVGLMAIKVEQLAI